MSWLVQRILSQKWVYGLLLLITPFIVRGVVADASNVHLAISVYTFLAARRIFMDAKKVSQTLMMMYQWCGIGLIVVGIADVMLGLDYTQTSVERANFIAMIREWVYVVGAMMLMFAAMHLPFKLESVGLRPRGHALRSLVMSVAISVVGVALVANLITRPQDAVYGLVSLALSLVFLWELYHARRQRLKKRILRFALACTLICIGRVVAIFIHDNTISEAYTLCWLLAMLVFIAGDE